MSFSQAIKKDLLKLTTDSERSIKAELSGIFAASATIKLDQVNNIQLYLSTENTGFTRWLFETIKNLYGYTLKIEVQKDAKLKGNHIYMVSLENPEQTQYLLKDLRILKRHSSKSVFFVNEIPEFFCSRQTYLKHYLRGVFLVCGYISNPDKQNHLELVSKQKTYLQSIREILEYYDIHSKIISRKNSWVLYIKEGESISTFFGVIGATRALLEFENIKILKGMRNQVNRQVNCEMANITKSTNAAIEQIEAIHKLEKLKIPLSEDLSKTAELRLKNPEASLQELAELSEASLTKSMLYRRLQKILKLAEEK